jgi:hypothetical protein
MISAHEYTEAAHQAIASLHIPGLAIVDMAKLPKPDRQTPANELWLAVRRRTV